MTMTDAIKKGIREEYLYVSGEGEEESVQAKIPETDVSVFHEVVLNPGEQYTIIPETLHWFQAGEEKEITFELGFDDLGFYREDSKYAVESGTFKVYVGQDSYAEISFRKPEKDIPSYKFVFF